MHLFLHSIYNEERLRQSKTIDRRSRFSAPKTDRLRPIPGAKRPLSVSVGLLTCVSSGGLSAFSEFSNDWLSPTAGRLDTYSAGSVGTCTPFSCSAGQSERPVRPRKHELGCNFRETTQKMVIACFTNGQNIAMTIPKQHSDETVGLPTRASSKTCPAFSGCPNDWLSPTDRFLNAHGIGQCGASRTL